MKQNEELRIIKMNVQPNVNLGACLNLIDYSIAKALEKPKNLALSDGVAGVAIAAATIYPLVKEDSLFRSIRELVDCLITGVEVIPMDTSLWTGLTGVLYALEYVRQVDQKLVETDKGDISEFLDNTPSMVAAHLKEWGGSLHFDLIGGLSGIGLYSLMISNRDAAKLVYSQVENSLFLTSTCSDQGRHWRTSPEQVFKPFDELERIGGKIDLGVAHGVAGVIGLLSNAIELGLAGDISLQMLSESTDWLLQQSDPTLKYSAFPSTAGRVPSHFTRAAWCYGDIGIGAVLLKSAKVLANPDLAAYARRLINDRLSHSVESYFVDSPGLCHGSAGLIHMLRLGDSLVDDRNRQKVLTQFEDQLRLFMAPKAANTNPYGLLEGAAGIALALIPEDAPAYDLNWGLCLGVSRI